MARYYFHIRDGDDLIPDPVGVEVADVASVENELSLVVRSVLGDAEWTGELVDGRLFEIVNERSQTILRVPFRIAAIAQHDKRLPAPAEGKCCQDDRTAELNKDAQDWGFRKDYAELLHALRSLQELLQVEKQKQFKRRVSIGDLITDRWQNAQAYGFGEGTSCYDNVLILGDVKIGRDTWIGPNVILDGSGNGLSIGSHCAISAGVQIYTHQTVRRTVTQGREPTEQAPTQIGDGVYIGPNSVVAMGVSIGESSVIGAMSFVNCDIPPRTMAWGCPAKLVGPVTL